MSKAYIPAATAPTSVIWLAVKLTPLAIRLIDGRNFATLATMMPDGSPHVTPMWIDREGDMVLVNTSEGRVKLRNISKDPRVAVSIYNQEQPYERVIIQGRVVAQAEEGAEEHIDKLAAKYTGAKKYQKARPDEKRVIIKIEPAKIF